MQYRELLHPLAIVFASLVIAGTVFLSDLDLRILANDDAAIFKFLLGALFLVVLAIFFQQQTQARQWRDDHGRHFARASEELTRMKKALRERSHEKD